MTTILYILAFFSDLVELFNVLLDFADRYPGYFLLGLLAIVFTIYALPRTEIPTPKPNIGDLFPIGSKLWCMFH